MEIRAEEILNFKRNTLIQQGKIENFDKDRLFKSSYDLFLELRDIFNNKDALSVSWAIGLILCEFETNFDFPSDLMIESMKQIVDDFKEYKNNA